MGNLYHNDGTSSFNKSYPAVWRFAEGAYALTAVLQDMPNGGQDLRVTRVSGDGRVVVGYSMNASGDAVASRWDTAGGAPTTLPALAGATYSVAFGTDVTGSTVVGYCGSLEDDALVRGAAAIWTAPE